MNRLVTTRGMAEVDISENGQPFVMSVTWHAHDEGIHDFEVGSRSQVEELFRSKTGLDAYLLGKAYPAKNFNGTVVVLRHVLK